MNSLNFGADGTLYFQHGAEAPLISAKTVFKFSKKDHPGKDLGLDFSFWAEHLTKDVYFEDGLTVKKFFECLMPWCDYFSHQAQVNLREYYNEMHKPIDKKNPFFNHADYIMLYSNVSFTPARLEDCYADISLHREDCFKYELSSGYFLSGFHMGKDMPIDISMVPMQYIADTPLFLMYSQTIQFGDYTKKKDSVFQETLKFPKKAYGVKYTTEKTPFFETITTAISLEEMLRSFFRYIFRDINKRDKGNGIKIELNPKNETSAEVLSFPGKAKEQPQSKEQTQEQTPNTDNVISLPFKKIAEEKKFSSIVSETLIASLFQNRLMDDMLIEYEKHNNPRHRLFSSDLDIGIPPEPRKGYIGLVPEEDN